MIIEKYYIFKISTIFLFIINSTELPSNDFYVDQSLQYINYNITDLIIRQDIKNIINIDYKTLPNFYNGNYNDEINYILNYNGGNLEPEWIWAKNISIVYTWVDGSDIDFIDIKSKYNGGIRKANSRDRSADELRYSLRSLEKYLPWHNGTIYIYTNQQIPKWLDITNSRIKMIFHKDIIPEYIYPTYDSGIIELFMDKIPNISEKFIYFNDDIFINNYIHPCFFFTNDTFYPKVYRRRKAILNNEKINRIIKKNNIHEIFQATKYFTREIVREYFDENFEYRNLYHTGHVFYRDLFEPFRQLFKNELRSACSNRFRNPYKLQTIYLYQIFMEYATKHDDFPLKLGGQGKAKYYKGFELPSNRTVKKYSCKVISKKVADTFIKFGRITDNSKSNWHYFNMFKKRRNLLVYNFNDEYTEKRALYELTEYMITRYPEPSSFEKKEYIELENIIKELFNKTNQLVLDIKETFKNSYNKNIIYKMNNILKEYKLNIIKEYISKKEKLSGLEKKMSKREKEEIRFLLSYNGEELEQEWKWAKYISFVYILENGNKNYDGSLNEINKLKYSLRSIEKYLPWHEGNIYIITQKQATNEFLWINNKNERIKILHQNDIIPENLFFINNKHIIEMYLDKISDLSEKFIYISNNHYFINYTHPRFFFSPEFYPKYNFKEALSNDEVNTVKFLDRSFFFTYVLIRYYFGESYATVFRYLKNMPCPLYRDLFEPVRTLYREYIESIYSNDLLPLYLVITYNIYGTDHPYYPEYVAGYGKVKEADLPKLNEKRTVKHYGFDITSHNIAKYVILPKTVFINNDDCNDILNKIIYTKKVFFNYDTENSNKSIMKKNTLIQLLSSIFNNKLSFENVN